MLTKTQTPHEFLIRWNDAGQLAGAHIAFREAIIDDGTEIASKFLEPQGVALAGASGFPLADVLGAVNVAALADGEAKAAQITALTADKTAAEQARDAALAQVADLQAQIAALQPPADVNGVPQSVPRRQAKTVMELTPHPLHGDLWQAALAAANAIEDRATRIVTTNYLLESLYFEHAKVSQLALGLLGMTQDQVDALFVAAAKL